MALELLAGPIPVRHEGLNDRTSYLLTRPQWLEGVGLAVQYVFYYDAGGIIRNGFACLIQLDGRACIRNDNPSHVLGRNYHLDLQGGEVIIDDAWAGPASYRRLSKITLAHLETVAPAWGASQYAFLPDRALYTQGSTVRSRAIANLGMSPNDDPTVEIEATLPDYQSGVLQNFSRGPDSTVYLAYNNGQLYHYDYEKRQVVGHRSGFGMSCQSGHYIPELGIFVSVHRTGTAVEGQQDWLRLWANEVAPETLTDPIALTPLTKGRVSTVEVTLTGSYNEPVVGFLVNWTLDGDGDLTATQSKTDSQGKARVGYRAPTDSTPTVEIHAEAVF